MQTGFGHISGALTERVSQLWQLPEDKFRPSPPELLHTFDCGAGAVLALVARGDTLYAGCQDGFVQVWDLETRTLVRTLLVVEVGQALLARLVGMLTTRKNTDILSMSLFGSDLYVCSANGNIQVRR